jgi:signal transduction histidine kinase
MRIERVQSLRVERQRDLFESLPFEIRTKLPKPPFMTIEVSEARSRIVASLFMVDVIILVLSGIAGYILAGRTLKPIQNMVDEQNQFIADASHELRTPLTALKSSLEVTLRDKNITLKDAKDLIKSNLEEVNELQSLSDSLLQLAQYQNIDGNLSFSTINLQMPIHEAVNKISSISHLKHISIEIHVKSITLETDAALVTEILVVLLDNAIKYSNEGSSIKINAHKTDGMVSISVADQGIGIADTDIPFIFNRFYRSDKSRSKESASGYGLGLSIAKKITELLGGSIQVASKENEGTTFMVLLPIKQRKI